MINLAIPNLDGNERKYLNECIDTTFVSSVGQFVTRLEKDVAEAVNAKYSVATSAGTTGLHIALLGSGVKRDELVIIPSFTFIATANAVAHCGAQPWLMDVDEKTWTLDPEILKYELDKNTDIIDGKVIHKVTGKRVAAIMPVYTLGTPADMDKINEIAKKYNLPVIADAAAAIGAKYKGKNVGELADLTVFSFNGNKTITCGGGGMVVGNNKEVLDKIRHMSTTARVGIEYEHDMVGYNYRMTNLQAAVGCAQMERLEEFIQKKRYVRNFYNNAFKDIKGISFFPDPDYAESACWFSGIVINNADISVIRDMCVKLKENDIESRTFWKPVHMQKPYFNCPKSSMDVCEKLYEKVLTLPNSTGISENELSKVADVTAKILEK